ncbi:MAG: hypothetical protein R3297_09160 [Desulfobulbales bacterium]|nr:hypothetical protein [Desulfobulbales bacterium]
MTQPEHENTGLEEAAQNLFNFAVNRDDVKAFVENLPSETKCKPAAVEYELQLLKIIATGWSISFFLENSPHREQVAESYWKQIHGFSADLSETTGLMTGCDIDYFQVVKSRLDMYVAALRAKSQITEPAAVIGPAFAKFCGNSDDVFSVRSGSRMFMLTVARVQGYLESIDLEQ